MPPLESTKFFYQGRDGLMSLCNLEIHTLPEGRVAVICSEREDNPGSCVTNCAGELAASVCQRWKIAPDKLIWIERNRSHGGEHGHLVPSFERVSFALVRQVGQDVEFLEPSWRAMSDQDWGNLGLAQPK
jgi:hypothetical protein